MSSLNDLKAWINTGAKTLKLDGVEKKITGTFFTASQISSSPFPRSDCFNITLEGGLTISENSDTYCRIDWIDLLKRFLEKNKKKWFQILTTTRVIVKFYSEEELLIEAKKFNIAGGIEIHELSMDGEKIERNDLVEKIQHVAV